MIFTILRNVGSIVVGSSGVGTTNKFSVRYFLGVEVEDELDNLVL